MASAPTPSCTPIQTLIAIVPVPVKAEFLIVALAPARMVSPTPAMFVNVMNFRDGLVELPERWIPSVDESEIATWSNDGEALSTTIEPPPPPPPANLIFTHETTLGRQRP